MHFACPLRTGDVVSMINLACHHVKGLTMGRCVLSEMGVVYARALHGVDMVKTYLISFAAQSALKARISLRARAEGNGGIAAGSWRRGCALVDGVLGVGLGGFLGC